MPARSFKTTMVPLRLGCSTTMSKGPARQVQVYAEVRVITVKGPQGSEVERILNNMNVLVDS